MQVNNENDDLGYLHNVEPITIATGKVKPFDFSRFNQKEETSGNDNEEEEDPLGYMRDIKPTKSTKEQIDEFVGKDFINTGGTRAVDDLSELTEFDFITPPNVYNSGAVDKRYSDQTVPEIFAKSMYNIIPAFAQGALMPISAIYSTLDYYVGNDNPYENFLTDAVDAAQENKYKLYGKDGELDLTDFTGAIEQVGLQAGLMLGTAPLLMALPASASVGALAAATTLASAGFMAYTEGMSGAKDTYNEKYKQVLKETNNDDYAKKVADTAAKVEVNTNVLLNTTLNIIPTRWLLKSNRYKILGDTFDDGSRLQYRYRPTQLANETLEDFEHRLADISTTKSTNLDRGLLDFTNKLGDMKYNLKNPREYLARNSDIIGEMFGEGLEEYHNAYAHDLAMKINNQDDIDSLGVGSIPYGRIGSDMVSGKFFKDMYNNNHFYDFAVGALVSGATSPFFSKMKLNRTKEYNPATGTYEYKYDRSKYNPFRDSSYFEYQDDEMDTIDITNKATSSLQLVQQMKKLNGDFISASDDKTRDDLLNQMMNVPIIRYLNDNTIDTYISTLEANKKNLGTYRDSITIDSVKSAYDKAKSNIATEEDKRDFNHLTSHLSKDDTNQLELNIKTNSDINQYVTKIKANIAKSESELNKHKEYVNKTKNDYNTIVKSFETQGITPNNDYGFLGEYIQNRIALDEELKLNKRLVQEVQSKMYELNGELSKEQRYINVKDNIDKISKELKSAILLKEQDANVSTEVIEQRLQEALKELDDIHKDKWRTDPQLSLIAEEKAKSDNRLKQYQNHELHLTTNSIDDLIDNQLQKLHIGIQSFSHQDIDLKLYFEYQSRLSLLDAKNNKELVDMLGGEEKYNKFKELLIANIRERYTEEELAKIDSVIAFYDKLNNYEQLLKDNKDRQSSHFLNKYFKNNKRLIDELTKYDKAKNDVNEFYRNIYNRDSPYAKFMSLYAVTDKYFDVASITDTSAIKDKIDNYNANYKNAIDYLKDLREKQENKEKEDNVNRALFIKQIDKLIHIVEKTGKDVERLDAQYNRGLYNELKDNFNTTVRQLYNNPKLTEGIIRNELSVYMLSNDELQEYVHILLSPNRNIGQLVDIPIPSDVYPYYAGEPIRFGKRLAWNANIGQYNRNNVYVNSKGESIDVLRVDTLNNTPHITRNMIMMYDLIGIQPTTFTTTPSDDYLFNTSNGVIDYGTIRQELITIDEMKVKVLYRNKNTNEYYTKNTNGEILVSDNGNVFISLNDTIDTTERVYTEDRDEAYFVIDKLIYTSADSILRQEITLPSIVVNNTLYTYKGIDASKLLIYVDKNNNELLVSAKELKGFPTNLTQVNNLIDYNIILQNIDNNFEVFKKAIDSITKTPNITDILIKINSCS